MQLKSSKTLGIGLTIALVALNLVFLNLILQRSGTRLRADLTEDGRYSLSEATQELVASLPEPAKLIFFHSSSRSMPALLKPLMDPLRDALAEFAVESDGKIQASFVELETAGKQAQDEAADAYGIRTMPIPVATAYEDSVKNVYFSVVVESGDRFEHIPLGEKLIRVVRDNSSFGIKVELTDIEYVIAKALTKVAVGFNSLAGALMAQEQAAKITVYLSDEKSLPENLRSLHTTVPAVAEKLRDTAPNRLEFTIKDPLEGVRSEAARGEAMEKLAQNVGIPPLRGTDNDYYAWAVIEMGDSAEAAPLIALSGEPSEAEVREVIEGILQRMLPGFLKTVGVVSSAPETPMSPMMSRQQPPDEYSFVKRFLGETYTVKDVDLSSGSVPREVEVLLLIKPPPLDESAIFALDQFLLRGGRVVVCQSAYSFDPQGFRANSRLTVKANDTGLLNDWLSSQGVTLSPAMVMDKRNNTLPIPMIERRGFDQILKWRNAPYPFYLRVDGDGLDSEHPITAFSRDIGLLWASPVTLGDIPKGRQSTVIMTSSQESATTTLTQLVDAIIDVGFDPGLGTLGRAGSVLSLVTRAFNNSVDKGVEFPPPLFEGKLKWLREIKTQSFGLAVAQRGDFTSYFKDRPLPNEPKDQPEAPKDGEAPAKDPTANKKKAAAPLVESRRPGSLVVIGDADFLSVAPFQTFDLGQDTLLQNVSFLVNALEWGTDDRLASIRNRHAGTRPLTALAGLSPEDRKREGLSTTRLTFIGTLLGLSLLGLVVFVGRKLKGPMPLDRPSARNGGQS